MFRIFGKYLVNCYASDTVSWVLKGNGVVSKMLSE